MEIGQKNYQLRKQCNITQEQLANAVGVSTPAVSKWETGVSMPDILLLAPIARRLKTTIDDLLSFQESLTEQEIMSYLDQIKNSARQNGLNQALEEGFQLLKRYPNAELLKLEIAMLPIMMAQTADEINWHDDTEYDEMIKTTTAMLEELTHSLDDRIKMPALFSIATRYMTEKRFDEAEQLLNKIPTHDYDTRHLFPSLYLMKGEDEKVLESAQKNLLIDTQHLLVDLRSQYSIYLKRKEYDRALRCANDYKIIVEQFGPAAFCSAELFVDLYLMMGDIEAATNYFLDYLKEIANISEKFNSSFYCSSISEQVVLSSNSFEDDIRKSMFMIVSQSEEYAALRSSVLVQQALSDLERKLR